MAIFSMMHRTFTSILIIGLEYRDSWNKRYGAFTPTIKMHFFYDSTWGRKSFEYDEGLFTITDISLY